MWELDYEESWAPKNWCFWTVVLEKTPESPLDYKEIQPVHPRGDQSCVFIGRTDAEAETPILWPPHAKNWLIGKDPDAGRDWGQEEKGTTEDGMAGWKSPTRWAWVWVNSGSWWWTGMPGVLWFMGSQRVGHDWATELILKWCLPFSPRVSLVPKPPRSQPVLIFKVTAPPPTGKKKFSLVVRYKYQELQRKELLFHTLSPTPNEFSSNVLWLEGREGNNVSENMIELVDFLFSLFWVKMLVILSSATLCDPMDCSQPGSSVLGISQANIQEWVAIRFFRISSLPRDRTWVSCIAGRLFTSAGNPSLFGKEKFLFYSFYFYSYHYYVLPSTYFGFTFLFFFC